MDQILAIANEYHVPVIEDAAQCIGAKYNGKLLGQLGTLNALSFHSTKNITSGLGGALILNDDSFLPRAKIIWQKGTNREAFLEGNVDKYTWQDLGSSYMINELGAALLAAQLERLEQINRTRLNIWQNYHVALAEAEKKYGYRRPVIPEGCEHNGHIYYLIAPNESVAVDLRKFLAEQGIVAPFHYIPLHMTPAGQKYAKQSKSLPVCEGIYQRVIRLPIWEGLEGHLPFIIDTLYKKMTRLLATRGEQP
jgi:dTDP-4-amino-4,6-dideoxygalactose transaminase